MELGEFLEKNGKFDTCILCNRKLKEGSEYPIGVVCRKKLNKRYKVAVINAESGCNEGPWVAYDIEDLKDYFGSSVDIFLVLTGGGFITLYFEDQEWSYNLYDGHDSDTLFEEVYGNRAFVVGWMIENGYFEKEIVHEDTNALTLAQHGTYLGPAKNLTEVKEKWGVCSVSPSCACGVAAEQIAHIEEDNERELNRWSGGTTAIHKVLHDGLVEQMEMISGYWNDICLLCEGTDWDSPVVNWLHEPLKYF